jgi:cytochrome c oxidase accessory protein FixG
MNREKEDFGDRVTTVDGRGRRKWIYALRPKGKLYTYRSWLSVLYLAAFFLVPFIRIKGQPLFLFNFPKATFVLFGKVFLPQDFIVLGIGMLTALLFIIVFTLRFGRVFCGWACPQTIFMEMVFRRTEYWIEGPAPRQMVADGKKWDTELYIRKAIKHTIFLVLSFLIANTFLAYIIGIDALTEIITDPVSEHIGGLVAIIGFTLAFYSVYAFVRELVCTVVCPYGRLQSVLLNKDSLVVTYNHMRGEPRSKRQRTEHKVSGDCIDCGMCVHVCPTGIDIRNGLQMECVNCTACIDACNMMMEKVNKPLHLIKIASESSVKNSPKSGPDYRSRMYTAILIVLSIVFTSLIAGRSKFDATVLRVPGQILQEYGDGSISNLYRIKIVNKSMHVEPYRLLLEDKGARIDYVGRHKDSLHPGIATEETFFIRTPPATAGSRKVKMRLRIMSGNEVVQKKTVTFIRSH